MKKIKKYIPLIVIGVVVLIGIILVSLSYGDFLGTRVLRKAASRVVAYQGEKVTIQVADSSATRKLELCVEKRNLLLGYSDFSNCKTLQYVLGPHVKSADITIPSSFPLGRALVITRVRDAKGNLIPVGPSDEKITLLIQKARPVVASHEEGSSSGGGGGGGGGGSSGGGGNGGGGSSSNDDGNSSEPQRGKIAETISGGCVDVNDTEVHVSWSNTNVIAEHRKAGESDWHKSFTAAYYDLDGTRSALLFNRYYSSPAYSSGALVPGDEIEIRLLPGSGYPNASNTDPSDTFRFQVPSFDGHDSSECVKF